MERNLGGPCVYDCMLEYMDWCRDLENCALLNKNRIVQLHRSYICERILTLRCPGRNCGVAVLDFNGCFALTCEICGCGFCAWCLADCGTDAHGHVPICPESLNPGDHFAPISMFNQVHNKRRMGEVKEYIESSAVESPHRHLVWKAIEKDLKDLGVAW